MKKKAIAAAGLLIGLAMLGGWRTTPEGPIVRAKGGEAVASHEEAESPVSDAETAAGIPLRARLDAPGQYRSEVSDATGRLNVYTHAEVEIPEVETVPEIYVTRHDFGQEDIYVVTSALFGNADVYDAGKAYETGAERGELPRLHAPYEFQEELIDPWMPEMGSVGKVYGFVRAADGSSYRYDLTKKNNGTLDIWAKKVSGESEPEQWTYSHWFEYDSMKLLYSWVPEESSLALGITKQEARMLAEEKAQALCLPDMELASSNMVLALQSGYSGRPRETDLTDIGYVFHYTRKPAGIPVTYTMIPGGGRESGTDSRTVPWGYESLDIYVTADGIDEIRFANQYDIGGKKAENQELLPFSDVMSIYEKMIILQNADALADKRAEGEDIGEPPQMKNIYIDRITFGYTRIYDPQSDGGSGLLVPVWDFFGTYEISYDGENLISVNDPDKSFLTIHAADGTLIDRWLGY